MLDFMKNYKDQTYALMRITTGFMFLCHGFMKFQAIEESARPWHIQWVAAPIELIGGALVMIGLFTTPVAFLCSGMAAAAYWIGHFDASDGLLPITNSGDAAALYTFVFLYISAKGTGIWGIGKD